MPKTNSSNKQDDEQEARPPAPLETEAAPTMLDTKEIEEKPFKGNDEDEDCDVKRNNDDCKDNDVNGSGEKKVNDSNEETDEEASLGSLEGADLYDDDDELQGDTWIEELECALLADCDPATLKKISEGRRIPSALRPDYWRALLALNDTSKVKLNGEYDLENQLEIRKDCESLVEDIATNLAVTKLSEADKLRLKSDLESTLTTYVKARPELTYIPGNGWTDILRVLYHLELSDTQLYQMFFRIVDRYIPKDLSYRQTNIEQPQQAKDSIPNPGSETVSVESGGQPETKLVSRTIQLDSHKKSIQAYHLLRLLIQYHDPELCSILDSRKVTPNLYVKDWFCSLFARSCSPKLALLIWDTHFKMADPFLIFFAAIVMVVNASDQLKGKNMNQAEMLSLLKTMPSQLEEDDIEDLYYLVSNHYTNLTPRSIRSYSHLFFMDTFENTYSGNESPEETKQPMLDLKTIQLTNSLDLSQYLCLPIVPAEIFTNETAQQVRSSPTSSPSSLKYFLVDCRPAEQYNAGHLNRAFHLDCSLMLREPRSFATAVQGLLEIQRQVVASKSNTGGQHVCFIGSGQEEEDQYVNMVVASFLQKYQKYVSIVVGGFDAIHEYVRTKSELKDSFDKYIVDHNEQLCKPCYTRTPGGLERFRNLRKQQTASSTIEPSSQGPQSLFSRLTPNQQATANMIAQSGVSMFDKLATAFVSKSSVIKERLVETLNTTTSAIPSAAASLAASASSSSLDRGHVSSHDKLGRRYTGSNLRYAIGDEDDEEDNHNYDTDLNSRGRATGKVAAPISEPVQEIQLDQWRRQTNILAFYKCAQIKGTNKYPGYVALSRAHLWILREIPHNKGFASVAAKRPLDMIVQITSKRRQPDLIIFRYGYANLRRHHNHSSGPQLAPAPDGSQDNGESSSAPPTGDHEAQPDSSGPSGLVEQPTGAVITAAPSGKPAAEKASQLPSIVASDHLHIPQAFELIRLIKREIVRIMDENSRAAVSESSQRQEATTESNPGEAINESASRVKQQ